MEREKSLQQQYADLQAKIEELQESLQEMQAPVQEPDQDGFAEEKDGDSIYEMEEGQQNIGEPVAAIN